MVYSVRVCASHTYIQYVFVCISMFVHNPRSFVPMYTYIDWMRACSPSSPHTHLSRSFALITKHYTRISYIYIKVLLLSTSSSTSLYTSLCAIMRVHDTWVCVHMPRTWVYEYKYIYKYNVININNCIRIWIYTSYLWFSEFLLFVFVFVAR